MTVVYMSVLEVKNLTVDVEDKRILENVSLEVRSGEIVVLMGPNGSGKSTLALTIMGHPGYTVVSGDILLDGESLLGLYPEERALKGLFLVFQTPPEVKGVRIRTFLQAISNKRKGRSLTGRLGSASKEYRQITRALEAVGLGESYMDREVNVGFSGGEKKRLELAQAMVFDPKILILDEPDSGLDVEGVELVARKIRELAEEGRAVLLITHYARLLKSLDVSRVAIMTGGRIVALGDRRLAFEIEEKGYNFGV